MYLLKKDMYIILTVDTIQDMKRKKKTTGTKDDSGPEVKLEVLNTITGW